MNVHFIYRYIIINMYTGAWAAAIYSELAETSLLIIEHRTLNQVCVWALPLHSLSLLLLLPLLPMMMMVLVAGCRFALCYSVVGVHDCSCCGVFHRLCICYTYIWLDGSVWLALFCCCYFVFVLCVFFSFICVRSICSFIYSPSFVVVQFCYTKWEIERDSGDTESWKELTFCVFISLCCFSLNVHLLCKTYEHRAAKLRYLDLILQLDRLKPETFALCLIVAAKSNNNQQSNVNLLNRSVGQSIRVYIELANLCKLIKTWMVGMHACVCARAHSQMREIESRRRAWHFTNNSAPLEINFL